MPLLRTLRYTFLPWQGNRGLWVIIASAVVFAVLFVWLTRPPGSIEEAEEHLGQDVVAFLERESIPYAAIRTMGQIRFDRLEEEPLIWHWPPVQHWVMDPIPWSIPATFDPAVVGKSFQDDTWMIYGEIRDPAIVTLEYNVDGTWYRAPVSAPGFIVALDEGLDPPTRVRWLDGDGTIVWEQPVPEQE